MSPGAGDNNQVTVEIHLQFFSLHFDSDDDIDNYGDKDSDNNNDDKYDADLSHHNCISNPLLTSCVVYFNTIGGDWNMEE